MLFKNVTHLVTITKPFTNVTKTFPVSWVNLGDFDLSRSLKVKRVTAIGLPIYDFLSMFNSNIGLKQALLRDIRLRNLSDLEFDFSRSLKVKYSPAIGLPANGFPLTYSDRKGPNSN